jgi:hypothetical protein
MAKVGYIFLAEAYESVESDKALDGEIRLA